MAAGTYGMAIFAGSYRYARQSSSSSSLSTST
jgi:hypothetical protein